MRSSTVARVCYLVAILSFLPVFVAVPYSLIAGTEKPTWTIYFLCAGWTFNLAGHYLEPKDRR